MPVNQDTSMSFSEMILELAVDVGLASYGAAGKSAPSLPDNDPDLAKVKSYVNKGYRTFIAADAGWTFCRTSFSLQLYPAGDGPDNINKDPARYRLPSFMRGHPATTPVYSDQISRVTHCALRDATSVLRAMQTEKATGVPRICAVRPIPGPDGTTSHVDRLCEMIFYPAPDARYVLEMGVRVHPYSMVDTTERHVCGGEHDRAIMAAATKAWRDQFSADPGAKLTATENYVALLAASKALDLGLRPRNLGKMTDPSVRETAPVRRGRGLVTHSNGQPII